MKSKIIILTHFLIQLASADIFDNNQRILDDVDKNVNVVIERVQNSWVHFFEDIKKITHNADKDVDDIINIQVDSIENAIDVVGNVANDSEGCFHIFRKNVENARNETHSLIKKCATTRTHLIQDILASLTINIVNALRLLNPARLLTPFKFIQIQKNIRRRIIILIMIDTKASHDAVIGMTLCTAQATTSLRRILLQNAENVYQCMGRPKL